VQQIVADIPTERWLDVMAGVAAALDGQAAAVGEDLYNLALLENPELRGDKAMLALLAASIRSNVDTCLQVMQHRIDLASVAAPTAVLEYARRLAQRGTPLTALLRAYRVGHARFSDWLLRSATCYQAGGSTRVPRRRPSATGSASTTSAWSAG
jgi:hypothetical protein